MTLWKVYVEFHSIHYNSDNTFVRAAGTFFIIYSKGEFITSLLHENNLISIMEVGVEVWFRYKKKKFQWFQKKNIDKKAVDIIERERERGVCSI